MTKGIIMGLDASSTTIGLSVLSYDDSGIQIEHTEYYKPPKKGTIFDRMSAVRKFISKKVDEFSPDHVALEDIVLFMGGKKCPVCKQPRGGKTTAKTITTLAVLNRTVGIAILDKLGKAPELLSVMKIRHAIKLDKKLPKKEEIPDLIEKIFGIDFPYKKNRLGNIAVENFDVADSIATGYAYYKLFIVGK